MARGAVRSAAGVEEPLQDRVHQRAARASSGRLARLLWAAGPENWYSSGQTTELLSSLSPSRAGDFMQCPLLYRFRVIDRLPEKPSEAATRGTLVHAVLERLFDAPAAERTAPRAEVARPRSVGPAPGDPA
ncbi:hypothetical protein SALBM311S_12268 [Streptomyces alboniger]